MPPGRSPGALCLATLALLAAAPAQAQPAGDWHADAPGVMHRIVLDALPPPFASRSASNSPGVIAQPAGAVPHVPAGFAVQRFATGLSAPRIIRVAPNGDIFVAESCR